MIIITKEEAMALRAKYGDDANITITSRNKKGGRKKYYAAEERRNLIFIEKYRNKESRKKNIKKRVGGEQ